MICNVVEIFTDSNIAIKNGYPAGYPRDWWQEFEEKCKGGVRGGGAGCISACWQGRGTGSSLPPVTVPSQGRQTNESDCVPGTLQLTR